MTPTITAISGDSRLTKPPTRDRISKAWIESHHQLNLNQLAHSNFNNHISERGPLCRKHRGSLPSLRVSGFIRIYNSHSCSSHNHLIGQLIWKAQSSKFAETRPREVKRRQLRKMHVRQRCTVRSRDTRKSCDMIDPHRKRNLNTAPGRPPT